MLFRQLFDPETSTYTYLIADLETKTTALFDPVLEQIERDQKLITELGLTLRYCLETHIHADHITGTGKLREITGCESIVPFGANAACADRKMQHGDVLQFGTVDIEAIATPGHTDSHMAYLVNKKYLLTGDSLLIRGCGRADFQGGDAGTLYDSITKNLWTLPETTLVYPGHDYHGHTVSTIGEEKSFNLRLAGRTRPEFIELMGNLNLPNPQKIMEAVPANQRCGNLR
ncbi:MBL fold metallo-hydrolase [Anabaena subtropica]|uniref:MBL fold metallo-hydrolase n=1 Tax=Anabaena subtropica FACHB-260 TaxID=2692884 RepID=A0ABR8CU70_9NOST|nr:MBL fold metallo-hydrolase [Anabaena subtropica]MBD2345944.1 MBL fold metallo-hydrolase [Anabaena subtropica FACHB-260]